MPLPTVADPVQSPVYAQPLEAARAPAPPQFDPGSPLSVFANSPPRQLSLGLEPQALPAAFGGMPPQEPFFGVDSAGLGRFPLQDGADGSFWTMLPPAGNGSGAFAQSPQYNTSSPPGGNEGGMFASMTPPGLPVQRYHPSPPAANAPPQYNTSSPLQGNAGPRYTPSSLPAGNGGGAFASMPQYTPSSPLQGNAGPQYTPSPLPAGNGGGAFASMPQYNPSSPLQGNAGPQYTPLSPAGPPVRRFNSVSPPPPPPESQYPAMSPLGSAFGMPWSPSAENLSNTRPRYTMPPSEEPRTNMSKLPPSQPGPPYAQTPWVQQASERDELRSKIDQRLKRVESPQPELRSEFEVNDIVRKNNDAQRERYIVEEVNPEQNQIRIRSLAPVPDGRKRPFYRKWHNEKNFRHATPPDEGRAAGGSRHPQPAAYGYRMVIPAHAYAGWQGFVPVW